MAYMNVQYPPFYGYYSRYAGQKKIGSWFYATKPFSSVASVVNGFAGPNPNACGYLPSSELPIDFYNQTIENLQSFWNESSYDFLTSPDYFVVVGYGIVQNIKTIYDSSLFPTYSNKNNANKSYSSEFQQETSEEKPNNESMSIVYIDEDDIEKELDIDNFNIKVKPQKNKAAKKKEKQKKHKKNNSL